MSDRVALVTEIVAPYRIPVFNAMNRLLGGRLDVIFINETEGRRSWPIYREEIEFDYVVLGGVRFNVPYRGDSQPVYLARPLVTRLERGGYRVVLMGGWSHVECYEGLAWAKLRRRRFVLWSETPLLGTLPHRPVRNLLKRLVVRSADACVVPGPSAARYLESLGAAPEAIHLAPNAVDNAFWSARPEHLRREDRPTLLFVGRLVPTKGLAVALAAFGRSRLAGNARFVVAGDGPQRTALERSAPPGVQFLGEQSREALRELYHAADVLVFPSLYDPWGLVLNEAACAGLPAIASTGAGATLDMIVDGENGITVAPGDRDALHAIFDRLADDPSLPRRLRDGAAALARMHTPEACAAGLVEAVR